MILAQKHAIKKSGRKEFLLLSVHVLFLSFLNIKYYFEMHLDGREGTVTFSVPRAARDLNLN